MSENKWIIWFLTSVLWVLAILAVTFIKPEYMTGWFSVFTILLSTLNLIFCVYVGNFVEMKED